MEPAARALPLRPRRAGASRHHAGRPDRVRPRPGPAPGPHQLEIVVPVYNEATCLEASISVLRRYLDESFPFRTLVTIADNGSTDGTALVAQRLASSLDGVQALILTRKGRGHALRTAWTRSEAPVVSYMDVDLATALPALLPLVGSVLSGHSDIAVGTRLARGSRVVRGPKRELISRVYARIVRVTLRSRISDFQCGFKAIRRGCALELLRLVEDDEWFFDTELLVTAERLGVRISEIPVDWTDDPASSVDIVATAADDLRGIWRVARGRMRARAHGHAATSPPASSQPASSQTASTEQLLSFAGVGLFSTLGYLLVFALGWRALGLWTANAAALAFCTLVNTALHRSLAAGAPRPPSDGPRRPPFLLVVGVLYGVSLAATTATIAVAVALGGSTLAGDALAALVGSVAASLLRFSLLRSWAFAVAAPGPPPAPR